jgi:hypothetical protein
MLKQLPKLQQGSDNIAGNVVELNSQHFAMKSFNSI